MKTISFSIAAYNVEKYIGQTLDSFISDEETMSKIEVIIVDDGSKDNTREIAEKYCIDYPNTFKLISKENGGYGSTINTSIAFANSKYFKIVDGDDWINSANLSKYVDYLDKVNTDLVLTKCEINYEDSDQKDYIESNVKYDGNPYSFKDIEVKQVFQMHEMSVRTDILKSTGISITEKCFYTDTEYVMKVLPFLQSFSSYDAVIYEYRMGRAGQSMQLSSWYKNINQAVKISEVLVRTFEQYKNEIDEKIKNLMYTMAIDSSQNKIILLLTLPDKVRGLKMIKEFDNVIKSVSKDVYDDMEKYGFTKKRLVVLAIRKSNYLLFVPLRILMKLYNKLSGKS